MKQAFSFVILGATLGLAGCGGGGAGTFGGGASGALNYVPAYATGPSDTTAQSIDDLEGVSGVLAQANTSLSGSTAGLRSIKVRLSADGNTAYLTLDGSTKALPVVIKLTDGGQFGSVPSEVLQVQGTTANNDIVSYSGSSGASGWGGFGRIGIETPEGAAPMVDTVYSGLYGGHLYGSNDPSEGGVFSGTMSITVNYDTGNMSGSFDVDINAFSTSGDAIGTISGATIGNGAAGTMTVTSGDYIGTMELAGKLFGFGAENFAGATAGTLTHTGGTSYATTGTFDLD